MGGDRRTWAVPLLGAAATLVVACVDLGSSGVVLLSLLVVGPLVAAIDGRPRWTLAVGAMATGLSVPLGWMDDIGGTWRHLVAITVNALGTLLAWRLAVARDTREDELREAAPVLARAARLTAAMYAGNLGDWWWDQATGEVGWDPQVVAMFGLPPGGFEGTFDGWLALVDPRDREMVVAAVAAGVADAHPFRFDHRCVWPDGSIHWIEGIGEVTIGRDGQVTGAVGIAFDVDERHRALDERTHLMAVEHQARVRAEYLARVHAVLATSLDIDEILDRVTNAAVPDLADWCSAVLVFDRPRHDPLIVAAHVDERMRQFAREVQQQFPYDPDAAFGAAKVIRTGEREVLTGLTGLRPERGDARDVLDTADVESVVTVAIVGPLGVLGALQLIRGSGRPPFADTDVDLVDELAQRCGAALHTAILFVRQSTSRAALDTLQRVSGALAGAATRHDVARAAIAHGSSGLRAAGAALFVRKAEMDLELVGHDGVSAADADVLQALAAQVIADDTAFNQTVELNHGVAALVTPLRILSRTTGALAFVFTGPRSFSDDEFSMVATLASRCAGALERAELYERERATALVLQRRLLPAIPALPPWLDVAARYEPAAGGQIGGDWYQFVDGGPGELVAVVGDAVGHGVASAAAMGQLRASIATAVSSDPDLKRAMRVVDTFAAQGMDTLGASAAFALFHESGRLQYGLAGHPPLVLVPVDGPARLLDEGRRPLLGFSPPSIGMPVSDHTEFRSGDMVVMYTDGLIERRRESMDVGFAKLLHVADEMREMHPAQLCDELIRHFAGSQGDDVAVVVIARR